MGLDDRPRADQLFTAPHIILVPGLAITLTVLALQPARRRPARRARPEAEPVTTALERPRRHVPADPSSRRRSRVAGPAATAGGATAAARGPRPARPRSTPATGSSAPSTGSTSTSSAARSWASSARSGCGKSVTSLSIMRLIAKPGIIEAGEVLFDGQDLLKLPATDMRQIRGNRISMIFQQPTSSLNPVWDVGRQIEEVLEVHRGMKRPEARERALDLLKMVGIPDPKRRLEAYPHELSGGMAQRVMIAMALACEPELLIADEPTTALDVTIQAQILDLMRDLRDRTGTAIILITHDLGVVAEMCDRVAVMYAGEIVEQTERRRPVHARRDTRTPAG